MKKFVRVLCSIFILLLAGAFAPVQQENELRLSLSRDFGYGGAGEIQGNFTMHIKGGPADITSVDFYIDDEVIGTDGEAPFAFAFVTDSFAPGRHNLKAIAHTASGADITTNVISVSFVAEDEVGGKILKTIGPMLAIIAVAVALAAIIPMLTGRGRKPVPLGTAQNYGLTGGAICPKCNRPFPLGLFKINLVTAALDRCPHCGKWSLVRHAPLKMLREIEANEREMAAQQSQSPLNRDDERRKKELDDSRYLE